MDAHGALGIFLNWLVAIDGMDDPYISSEDQIELAGVKSTVSKICKLTLERADDDLRAAGINPYG